MILRPWTEADVDAWRQLHADSSALGSADAGDALAASDVQLGLQQVVAAWNRDGIGLLACEPLDHEMTTRADTEDIAGPIGSVGFAVGTSALAGTAEHEIEWHFLPSFWGKGYAFEAAWAALMWGFEGDHFPIVGAIVGVGDDRSKELAERLGMEAQFRTVSAKDGRWSDAYTLEARQWLQPNNQKANLEDVSPTAIEKG